MTVPNCTRANRANAKKSTGPKTNTGKSIASQNAIKHGILSQRVIVGSESQEDFNNLAQDLFEVYAPRDQMKRELVDRIIYALWKQRRLRHAETASAALSIQPAVVLKEMNASAVIDYIDRFKLSDFSNTTISRYEGLDEVLQTLQSMDYQKISANITSFEENYPTLKPYLEKRAKQLGSDYSVIKNNPAELVELMKNFASQLRDILAKENKGYRALQLKALIEQTNQIPRDTANQYLARYQVQLDNEVYKAMEMLRKYREWNMQFIETVEDVIGSGPESNAKDAANEDELEVA